MDWLKEAIRTFLEIDAIDARLSEVEDDEIEKMIAAKAKPTAQAFIRERLGSIDLSTARDIVKTPDQIKAYEGAIAGVFKDYIEPTLKRLIIAQDEFMGRMAQDIRQLDFGRGTDNGLILVLEEFEIAYKNHQAAGKEPETINESEMFPSTPSLESLTVKVDA